MKTFIFFLTAALILQSVARAENYCSCIKVYEPGDTYAYAGVRLTHKTNDFQYETVKTFKDEGVIATDMDLCMKALASESGCLSQAVMVKTHSKQKIPAGESARTAK